MVSNCWLPAILNFTFSGLPGLAMGMEILYRISRRSFNEHDLSFRDIFAKRNSSICYCIVSNLIILYIYLTHLNLWFYWRETKKHHDHSRLIYYPTHARCGPWIVGLGLGFIMYTFRNQKTKLNKRISRVLWIVATSLMTASVLGHYPFQQSNNHISYLFNAAYNALSRSCWAMSLAWVIFACHNGGGGFIRWFLCLSLFKPLARMSLSIYLTHRLHQILSIASMKLPYYLSVLNLLHAYFSDVIMSSFIGMAVYLCIEAPVTFFRNRLYQ